MTTPRAGAHALSHPNEPAPTLSLTEGGPGAAVIKRLRFGPWDLGAAAPRTAVLLAAITWIPLLVLSVLQGTALGGVQLPFLHDIAAYVRFLFAVPVLVLADPVVGARLRRTVTHFLDSGVVPPDSWERFASIIADSVRFRDSRVAELVVLGAAYLATYLALRGDPAHGLTCWFATPPDGGLTAVGYWYAFVALPIFQFLVLRWIYRMIVWARFLLRVTRLDLQHTPTHPDGAGGLGFLGKSAVAFGPVLLALSAVTASAIANQILFAGATLAEYQATYGAFIVLALLVFAGPLFVFMPGLAKLKRESLLQYGTLATEYTVLFHRKWVGRSQPSEEPLLGHTDIQSLADLASSYDLVRKMRVVPIEIADFVRIAVPAAVPALPLLATVMPVADILKNLLRLIA
jgi:hypothetical protein